MLSIDVPQPSEDFLFPLVERIEEAEVQTQLFIGFDRQIHLPDSFVIAQEWVANCCSRDAGLEGGAGQSQTASLRRTKNADPGFVNLGESHHDPSKLGTVEEDLAEEELLRRVIEAADDMSAQGTASDTSYTTFSALMDGSHISLRDDCEAFTLELDAFVVVAKELAALGARLTRAGFGDCAIALLAEDLIGAIIAAVQHHFALRNFAPPVFYPA